MDGKGTLKMFRKKRELIKTPSISKKSRAGSPGPQSSAPSRARSMLKRGGKNSYNPYSTSQRVKKAESKGKDRLDILPNRHNVWLKQLSILQEQPRRDAVDVTLFCSPSSSSSSSSTLTPTSAGLQDPSASCPGTPSAQHNKLGMMQGVGCPSPVATLKRPTALSRHASAAGFPLQSWVFTRGQGKGAITPTTPSDSPESVAIEVEDIPALLRDVARFAEAVEKLKDVVLAEGKESQRPVAHECLGEVLRILRQVINTYPLLNTVEILTAAGKLISKVKGFHYESSNEADKKDFEKAIETIAVAFSSNVSELLMGEVDSSTLLSLLPTEKSRSMENLYTGSGHGGDGGHYRSDLQDMGKHKGAPLMQRKQEHEKRRKEIKEHWIRAKRKLMECEANLRKAKQAYIARCEEYDKAKTAACRAEEEGGGSTAKSVEKKKRVEEEARNKADEAEATYKTCIADAATQQQELEHTKVTVLRQLQDIIKQSDQTIRSATISYYQLMHMQTVALPVHYQTLCESSKLYDPGQQYAAHVRDLQLPEQPSIQYAFESYSPSNSSSHHGHRPRNDSFNTDTQTSQTDSPAVSAETTAGESRESECFLACHKRCLETLAIQCGHKKLQGRLQLFGRDFTQVASCASDGIPFIITKCISEIERRALKMKGIYRVNGVKTRVEKLCQAFENGKELVELSQCSPHDISNVLKLYLRQLPEPIMPFHLYNKLMGLAKESLHNEGDTPEGEDSESSSTHPAVSRGPELVDLGPDTDPEVLVLVDSLRELLKELPKPNIATLRYIVRHLRRIAELEEDNKMSPSNLGIVFGPSLMRPRPTGATISLSSLVDYPHQARIVEAFIVFYSSIFQSKTSQTHKTSLYITE
ncbi:rho GTPase-activating protein 45 [Neolamprologus brichardi]|uniref:rho GTPase-activating protein 45 n=1 Tax=Neolamprologus brichardi TaxID=32507 RepID=UPI001643B8C5|nr:rho GTPase-activating protein 45 [Neolamprologus brichardi]